MEGARRFPAGFNHAWDMTTRVVASALFLGIMALKLQDLEAFMAARDAIADPGVAIQILSRAAMVLFVALVGSLFLVRLRPVAKAEGARPRLAALAGTFLSVVLPIVPAQVAGSRFRSLAATVLILAGTAVAVVAVTALGRSFSLMPEARRLVTRGAYRFVRHPLYFAEDIAALGVVIENLSIFSVVIFGIDVAIQFRRMAYEEALLERVFPDYQRYRERVRRLIPGIY
ncbi:MAG: isoprenylcysteine carboxylmethyltransferase family protein [Acidobacteria bacterium]|nr:isoprenylcysteine carboxylmethyltransferase family protein [Acidobacteriota bacterium]